MFLVVIYTSLLVLQPTLQQQVTQYTAAYQERWFGLGTITQAPRCQSEGQKYCKLANLYVQTVMRSVTGILLRTPDYSYDRIPETYERQRKFSEEGRYYGNGRPVFGLTMVGFVRLVNIREQMLRIMNEGIEGDFLEAGVWRGGCPIVAKAVIEAFEGVGRVVHVVDSFQGLPVPRKQFAQKDTDEFSKLDYLSVSLRQVQANFQRYGLLDEQVLFHQGFFNESLPRFRKENPAAKIAFLRLDGDMYESTTDILYNLYEFVPIGGAVVVDDWYLDTARDAFKDFFQHHDEKMEEMVLIGKTASYMIKSKAFEVDYKYYLDNFIAQQQAA